MTATEMPRSLAGGRYLLVKPLGEGGMASVFRAYDQRLQVWRAIKILAPHLAKKAKLRQRFEAEAQTMALLEHRNIVRVYDVGTDDDFAYIVMEVVEGGCLVDWLEDHGPMPPRLAVETMLQVCDGIAFAHKKGVIHRDIKPHNVLVTIEGVCRVTDFGIARVEDNSNMTKTGAVMGTWGYMAPEQRSDAKHVDGRADEYALGATLYSLLTNKTPMDLFAADRDASMMEGVPEQLLDVLIKSTEYRKEDRYADVPAFAEALRGLLAVLPPDPAGTPSIARPAGPPLPVPNAADFVKVSSQQSPNRETSVPPVADNATMIPDVPTSEEPRASATGATAVPARTGHAAAITYGPDAGGPPGAHQNPTYIPGYTIGDHTGPLSIPPGYPAPAPQPAGGGLAMWVVAAGLGFVGLSVLVLVAVIAFTQSRGPGAAETSTPNLPTVADVTGPPAPKEPVVEAPPVDSPAPTEPGAALASPTPPVAPPPTEPVKPPKSPSKVKVEPKVEPKAQPPVEPKVEVVAVPSAPAADCLRVDSLRGVSPGVPVNFVAKVCDGRNDYALRVFYRPVGGAWKSSDLRQALGAGRYQYRLDPDESYRNGMEWYIVGPNGWGHGSPSAPIVTR